jgi:hypothetical protein
MASIFGARNLLVALKSAKEVIKTWHGIYTDCMCAPTVEPAKAWEVYDRESPEMQQINAAIGEAERNLPDTSGILKDQKEEDPGFCRSVEGARRCRHREPAGPWAHTREELADS